MAEIIEGDKEFSGAVTFTSTPFVGTLDSSTSSGYAASTKFVQDQNYTKTIYTISGRYAAVRINDFGQVTEGSGLLAEDIPVITSSKILDFNTSVRANKLHYMAPPTAQVALGGQRLTDLGDPIIDSDAVTKRYLEREYGFGSTAAASNPTDPDSGTTDTTTATSIPSVGDASIITLPAGSDAPNDWWAVYDISRDAMATWNSTAGRYVFAPTYDEIQSAIAEAASSIPALTDIYSQIDVLNSSLSTNVATLTAAQQAEVNARISALTDEAAERTAAILTEVNARIAAQVANNGQQLAYIEEEAETRQGAVDSLVTTITDLTAAYDLSIANITTTQNAYASALSSMAETVASVSAGTGTQFDAAEIWYFDTTTESWTGNGSPTVEDSSLRPDNASNPYVLSPVLSGISAASYKYVKARILKVGSPTWEGSLYWTTTQHPTYDESRKSSIAEPTFDSSGSATLDWNDIGWGASYLTQIRLDIGSTQTASDYFLIDWVAVGRPTPGASTAALESTKQALITAIAAEATAREALAVQMAADLATQTGLINSEATIRAQQDLVLATRASLIEASMSSGSNLLTNAGFETDIDGWAAVLNEVSGDPVSVVEWDLLGTAGRPTGMHTLGIMRDGVPTGSQSVGTVAVIAPGERHCLSGWLASRRCTTRLSVTFRDSAGADISGSTTYTDPVTDDYTGGASLLYYQRVYAFVTAPTNAAYAYISVVQDTNGGTAPYSWLCRPLFEQVSAVQTSPSTWTDSIYGVTAKIASLESAITSETEALTQSIDTLTARVTESGGDVYESIVQVAATANATKDALEGTWGVTLDVGGNVSGLKATNDGSTSSFKVTADQVLISATNMVIDEWFYSSEWWSSYLASDNSTEWPANWTPTAGDTALNEPNRYLKITAGSFVSRRGTLISAEESTAYRVRLRIYRSSDFVGKIFAGMHVPSVAWAMPGPVVTDPAWCDGISHLTNEDDLGEWVTYSGIWTTSSAYSFMQARIAAEVTAGYCCIYLECIRAVGSSLIVDGSITAQKVASEYTSTVSLSARNAVIDYASINSLSSLSAKLGTITSGQITLGGTSPNEHSYLRTGTKAYGDNQNGFILGYSSTYYEPSFYQEFRHFEGDGAVLERKGGFYGTDPAYHLEIIDGNGVERLYFDTGVNAYRFGGTLSAPSGTLGTITAGLLRNSTNTTSLNLNETGSGVVLRINGTDRVWGNGNTNWSNPIATGMVFTVNQNLVEGSRVYYNDGEETLYTDIVTHKEITIDVDTGIIMDAVTDGYVSTFHMHIYGYSFTLSDAGATSNVGCKLLCSAHHMLQLPVSSTDGWGNVTLHFRVTFKMTGSNLPAGEGHYARLDNFAAHIHRHT